MKELTIKELAPYLPYDIKVDLTRPFFQSKNIVLMGFTLAYNKSTNEYWVMKNGITYGLEHIKPILRPLSELTKPITHNNETFVPIERLEQGENGSTYREYSSTPNELTLSITYKLMGETFTDIVINRNSVDSTKYEYVQKLLEWHFDIFSLLENNLAIDITTLK